MSNTTTYTEPKQEHAKHICLVLLPQPLDRPANASTRTPTSGPHLGCCEGTRFRVLRLILKELGLRSPRAFGTHLQTPDPLNGPFPPPNRPSQMWQFLCTPTALAGAISTYPHYGNSNPKPCRRQTPVYTDIT